MNAPKDKPRWHYRFASFAAALSRLREAADDVCRRYLPEFDALHSKLNPETPE